MTSEGAEGYGRCTCSWQPVPHVGGKYMTMRDTTCRMHGNDTAWWRRQKDAASALGATLAAAEGHRGAS